MFGSDTRFSQTTSYILYAQYVSEAEQIREHINIALRKKKPSSLDGRTPVVKDVLINYDDGYRVLSNVRGSPSSWQKNAI